MSATGGDENIPILHLCLGQGVNFGVQGLGVESGVSGSALGFRVSGKAFRL